MVGDRSDRSESSSQGGSRRQRRLSFAAIAMLILYGLLELLSCGAYAALEGETMSLSALQSQRSRIVEGPAQTQSLTKTPGRGPTNRQARQALHPYTGHINTPGSTVKHYDSVRMNGFGYAGDDDMFAINDNQYVVAIAGGSLSMRLFLDRPELIQQEIAELRGIPGEQVKLVCLAMSAFKQPQTLMAVVNYLALGGRIDLLINVDGFNEIAGLRPGLHPAYPTHWPRLVASTIGAPEIEAFAQIASLRDRSASQARFFSALRFSATANLAWLVLERSLERRIAASQIRLDELAEGAMQGASFAQVGPELPDGVDVMDSSVDIWLASSLQLQNLASGNGFSYYQFLQPNQYLQGAKEFGEAERERALKHAEKWSQSVNRGYPKLLARESELRRSGVDFTDLTGVFRDVEAMVYRDSCCHLNEDGADHVVRAILRRIRASLARTPAAT